MTPLAEISQQTLERIKAAADIVDVVGEHVTLQPAGKNFKGLCPFHQEKTPSFFVSKERQLFHCFGCGEKGGSINFIQKFKRLSFVDAIRDLADKYNIPLDLSERRTDSKETDKLFQINQMAEDYYQLALTNFDTGKIALEYLTKRGLDRELIQAFKLGYASEESTALYDRLNPKYLEIDLIELGLIKKNDSGRYYDLFRERVIFPVHNEFGKPVGFSGRIIKESKTEPKYVNSPFTKLFVKGDILYNLDLAQTAIRQSKRIILFEGFMDVIAAYRAGVKESVASMGTALTPSQAKLIKKYADNVILSYDGDRAGIEAMNKAISILEEAGLIVTILVFPDDLDPDEYLKKAGAEALKQYIETEQIDKWEFRYRYLKRSCDFKSASSIERFKMQLFALLVPEASQTVINLYINRLAADILIDPEVIRSDYRMLHLAKRVNDAVAGRREQIQSTLVPKKYLLAETTLVNYCLKELAYREMITNQLTEFFAEEKINRDIMINLVELAETADLQRLKIDLVSRFSKDVQAEVQKRLLRDNYDYTVLELNDCITMLKDRNLDREIQVLQAAAGKLDPIVDEMDFKYAHNQIQSLKQRKEALWKKPKS